MDVMSILKSTVYNPNKSVHAALASFGHQNLI